MIAWWWVLVGMGSMVAVSAFAVTIANADMRRAVGQVVLAGLLGPSALLLVLVRRGPRLQRITPAALERFCRQVDVDMQPAWLLTYRGRGILYVRRRVPGHGSGDVANRAQYADRGGRSRRTEPIEVTDRDDTRNA